MRFSPGPAAIFPLPMLITVTVLLSTPLWLTRAGLYQYLALEIMIWMLFALGYNLLLGTSGLPSFGHGAYFGIGAYAFGLLQQKWWANLWFDLLGPPWLPLRWQHWSHFSSPTVGAFTTPC